MARASQAISFPVFGYVDSENPWEKIKAVLPNTAAKTIYAEFDHLNVNKFHGLQTIFSGQFNNLTPYVQGMRLVKSADEINKMMIAGQFADKAVQVGFDNISLDATETDVIAQIEFEMKNKAFIK